MHTAQDHKRALNSNGGLNTGGMGAYAQAPCVTPELHRMIESMCVRTAEKMDEDAVSWHTVIGDDVSRPKGAYLPV